MTSSLDAGLFRAIAGTFASGVTVVTTGAGDSFHGMTASSFSSVSLEPTLILVCIDRTAATLQILEDASRFNLNILSAHQESLARRFASRGTPAVHGLNGVDYELGSTGLPVLSGCLAHFECRVMHEYEGGDHMIVVGSVEGGAVNDDGEPLLYYRGRYRKLEAPNTDALHA